MVAVSQSGTPNMSSGPLGMLPLPGSGSSSSAINSSAGQVNYHSMSSLVPTTTMLDSSSNLDIYSAPRQQYLPQSYSYMGFSRPPVSLQAQPQSHHHQLQPQIPQQSSYNHQQQYHSQSSLQPTSQHHQHLPLPQLPQLIDPNSSLSSQAQHSLSSSLPPPPIHHDEYTSHLPPPPLANSHSSNTLSSMGSMNSLSSFNDDMSTDASINSPSAHGSQLHHQTSIDRLSDHTSLHDPNSLQSKPLLKTKASSSSIINKRNQQRRKSSSHNLRKTSHNYDIMAASMPPLPTDMEDMQYARKPKFSTEDDELLIMLKEERKLTWKQIAEHFDGRTAGSLQVRYCTKLKRPKTPSWSEEDLNTLKDAVHEYESQKWGVVSEKLGNKYPADICRDKYRQSLKKDNHSARPTTPRINNSQPPTSHSSGGMHTGPDAQHQNHALQTPQPISSIPMMHNSGFLPPS
ncbi:hypothetical protein AWJ20_4164 [Sugiyamaella lignohabitans]|uniref:Uncharacterized protein n=1 Tax=Sugiyamaella lignohabitans TaxID=796027 RepID=A0A161HJ51_9ASCO|nr:uncharacterized protein AWJ20_4164 [Sugiyamaella lignohabitans]ANB11358.1 hypothetical protein AWJ20_4164 [Sugiyamaella lignohabitans]